MTFTITGRAVEKAREFRDNLDKSDDWVLAIGLKGGGCSGFKYEIDFMPLPDDEKMYKIIERDGLRVFCDKKSYIFLAGTEIDYEETMISSGFVFNSPMASSKCGCGESVGF